MHARDNACDNACDNDGTSNVTQSEQRRNNDLTEAVHLSQKAALERENKYNAVAINNDSDHMLTM